MLTTAIEHECSAAKGRGRVEDISLNSTQRFSNRVADYIAYRPSYPQAVVDLLRQECGLTAEWIVADIGSGPGNLTRLFLDHGNQVFGIEPNAEMREAGERLLQDYSRFTSVTGTAEETTLADESVDLIVAGQAFHWFDPERTRQEFTRILRPPRWVALVWNERRIDTTPFLAAYEQLLQTYGTDYATLRYRNADASDTDALDTFFSSSGYRLATFGNTQLFNYAGLRGRLLSSSYAPVDGQQGHDAMLEELRALFDAHQESGVVAFEYDTAVYYGHLQDDAGGKG